MATVDLLGPGGGNETVDTHRNLEKHLKAPAPYMTHRRVEQQTNGIRRGVLALVPEMMRAAAGGCFPIKTRNENNVRRPEKRNTRRIFVRRSFPINISQTSLAIADALRQPPVFCEANNIKQLLQMLSPKEE